MENSVIISLSKKKALLSIAGAFIFVIFGCFAAIRPEDLTSPIMRSAETIRIFGVAAVIFFGFCLAYISYKLFDNRPGLIIDQNGITDNTNASSLGFIEWDDITGIESRQVMSTKFLILRIHHPDKYIKRAKNVIVKRAVEMNYKTYGSPITIIANSLKIDFDHLEGLIRSEFEKRKESKL